MNTEQERADFEVWWESTPILKESKRTIAEKAYQTGRAALQSQVKNDTTLFCDLKTDEEKCAFFLSGRGYETGVIAHAIQNDVAMAYHRCAEYKKELEALQSQDREQDRIDAERYRWLRADNAYFPEENYMRGGQELDEAIDHARRVEGEGE